MPAAFSAVHERVLSPLEVAAVRPVRERLIAHASGHVVELGGGTGENLALYDADTVNRVTVIGPDSWTRPALERRAREAAMPVDIVEDAPPAGIDNGSVDVVVITLLLCSSPDRHGLLMSVRRLLRDGGQLLFIEHTPTRLARGLVGDLVSPMWRAVTTGCDLKSDPLAAIRGAGFLITDIERFTMPTFQLPIRACVAGIAR